jgi:hypothetical protein
MRPLLVALALAALVPPVGAQTARGLVVGGGEARGASGLLSAAEGGRAGWVVEATGPRGAFVAARYLAGVTRLQPDADAWSARYGAAPSTGGGGLLIETGVEVEAGWTIGPVRPYLHRGYLSRWQRQDAATVETSAVPSEGRHAFSSTRGQGVALVLGGGMGVFAERFRHGGAEGVMALSGTRFGVRLVR